MPTTPLATPASRTSRKFGWLAVAIVAACALWTLGWFLVAARIEGQVPQTIAQLTGPNAAGDCEKAEVRGYPFRFGLFCEAMSYASSADNLTASAGSFRSAAQFYRPGHVVAEVDGPLSVAVPGIVTRIDWKVLQTSVHAALNGLNRGSLDVRNISFDFDGAGLVQKLALQADRITAHGRKNGPDMDFAAYGDQLKNNLVDGLVVRAFTLETTLPGQAALLDMPFVGPTGNIDILIHRLLVDLDDDSSLEISGPVEIGVNGEISGSLQLTVRNQLRFLELAADLDPNLAGQLRRFMPLLASLDTRPDDDGITLPLTLENNLVSLGIFPLGKLPGF